MTKKFVLVFLILVIINQRYSEMDYFNLEFINFPKEITISKNIEMEKLNVVIKCYYKYNGPTTVCKGNKGFFRYYISGDILVIALWISSSGYPIVVNIALISNSPNVS